MPIFARSLQKIDYNNPQDALKKMASHIKYIQEQLEYTLLNLDSRHITEIDTDSTTITSSSGSTTTIGNTFIKFTGPNGESFTAGKNENGQFEFSVNGKNGQTMYLNSSGNIVITDNSILTIDGGEW